MARSVTFTSNSASAVIDRAYKKLTHCRETILKMVLCRYCIGAAASLIRTVGGSGRGQYEDHWNFFFDADYLQRLKDGDGATGRFARYFVVIRIKASIRMRSREALEDVRQETLLRVLRNLAAALSNIRTVSAPTSTRLLQCHVEHFRGDSRWSQFRKR